MRSTRPERTGPAAGQGAVMRCSRIPALLGVTGLLISAGTGLAGAQADSRTAAGAAPRATTVSSRGGGVPLAPAGAGAGASTALISVASANAHPVASSAIPFATLGQNGLTAGPVAKPIPDTAKPRPAATSRAANWGPAPHVQERRVPPTQVNGNFAGILQGRSDCGGCQPPDPNAAISPTQITHVVNLR